MFKVGVMVVGPVFLSYLIALSSNSSIQPRGVKSRTRTGENRKESEREREILERETVQRASPLIRSPGWESCRQQTDDRELRFSYLCESLHKSHTGHS
ncbi:hypothetical protein NL676_016639 [Syzygium grande]|nr:hypothetical protein NL676_016639 [Syzygium grande]